MTLKIKKSASAGVHIDEGEYTAIIESIQVKKWDDGGESYAWTFKIKNATLDGDEIEGNVRINGLATALFTTKSKLCKWAEGAGLDIESDEIDLEEAVGKVVRVYVEDHETKEGATISKISKVKPMKKKEVSEGKPVKKKTDEDDEDEKPKKKKEEKKAKKDDEDEKPKKKKPRDEDDEEEEKPKKKKEEKKAKKDDDDDEEDELFQFDDDDDDED